MVGGLLQRPAGPKRASGHLLRLLVLGGPWGGARAEVGDSGEAGSGATVSPPLAPLRVLYVSLCLRGEALAPHKAV